MMVMAVMYVMAVKMVISVMYVMSVMMVMAVMYVMAVMKVMAVHVRRTHGIVCALLWVCLMYVGGAGVGTCNYWST